MTIIIINYLKEFMLLQLLISIVFFRKATEFNALKLLKTFTIFSRADAQGTRTLCQLPTFNAPAMFNCCFVFAVSLKTGQLRRASCTCSYRDTP